MALIVCPECHQKVSDTADACPKCGFKLKVSQLGWLWAVGVFIISTAIGEVTGNPYAGIGAFIGMTIVFFIRQSKKDNLQKKIEEANPVAQEPEEQEEPVRPAKPAKPMKIVGSCSSCGGGLTAADKFCPDCGQKV